MTGFRGLTLEADNPIVAAVRTGILAAVLFSYDVALLGPVRNIESPEQVAALNAGLRELAETPLLIAADQEGGWVARLNEAHGFPATLSHQEPANATTSPSPTTAPPNGAHADRSGYFNYNFAAVVDVNTNPDNPVIGAIGRSFSDDPAIVTEHAAAFIRAHRDAGVTTTLKHFPGHGSSRADSHLGFVDVTETWQQLELEPYRDLIGEGLVDSIMTAHVFNGQLDPDTVATLSKPVITGILREEMGFDGVIFSDDMQMSAIAGNYGFEEAVIGTVAAGVDVLAVGSNLAYDPEIAVKIVDILAAAVMAGQIDEAQIDASNRRIAALKAKSAGGALSDA